MSLMLDPAELARRSKAEAVDYFQIGQAFGLLNKEAAAPVATPVLHGRLIVSKSGWALLTVPNALVRGLFDAMDEKGLELPPGHEGGPFTAHISVMRGEEVDKIGGPDKISERGHPFSYQLGPIMAVEPKGWSEMSRVWFAKVISPELKALRRSYGLPPLPNGDHDFHISIAVRRKNVMAQGPVSKAAADESEDKDDKKKTLRLPLVIQRIAFSETRISTGKDGDDDGIKEFMDRIRARSRKASEKQAADYVFHGDVQGVGLRKNLHRILEEQGRPGLAYNDARANQALVSLPGRARSHGPVFRALDEHLKGKGADYSFTTAPGRERHQSHTMNDEDIAAFMKAQGFINNAAKPIEEQRKWITDRWRMKETPGGQLVGALPPLAIAQLQGKEPVYSEQLTPEGGYGPNIWNTKAAGWVRTGLGGLRSGFRHAAGVPQGEGFFGTPGTGFGSRTATSAKNLGQVFTAPRIPGLSRSVDDPTSGWRGLLQKSDERTLPFDRTRNLIGEGFRQGSRAATVGSLGVAGYGALNNTGFPAGYLGQAGAKELELPLEGEKAMAEAGAEHLPELAGPMRAQMFGHIPGVNWFTGKPDDSALGRAVGDVGRETAIPMLRRHLYLTRQNMPGMKAIDLARSFSPAGLVTNAISHRFASPDIPDYQGAVDRAITKHLPEAMKDPVPSLTSPFMRPVAKLLADPRVRPYLEQSPVVQKHIAEGLKGVVASPEAQSKITEQTAGGVHGLARSVLGLGAGVAGASAGQTGPAELVESALPAARQGLGQGLSASWADPEVRNKVMGLGLAAGAGGLGGGVLGHVLGSAVSPDDEGLSYEERRAKEKKREWMRNLGILGGGVAAPALAHYFSQHKAAAAVLPESMQKVAADYAPGLPAKKDYGPLERLRVGQMLDYIVQAHNAERAGPHHDIRFGDKDTGLLSWASRKGVPAPGEKRLAVQQPVHRHEYKDFEGEIPEGYGKGTVKKHEQGQVLITKVTPESVHFTTAHGRHPERFTLARPKGWGDKNWLMMNTTPRDQVPYEKVRYKKIPPEQVEPHLRAMQEGDSAEAKVDGASQLVQLAKGHAEMLSFRTSKQTGRPIFHTERFFGGRPDIPVPRHLEGSILKGEMYAAHTGRPEANGTAPPAGEPGSKVLSGNGGPVSPAPGGGPAASIRAGTPQDVGTLLNSGIARSLQLQKERGLHLRNMLYDVQQYGKTPVDPSVTPRNERRKMLEEIAGHLPADKFHVSEEARDPEAAVKLWNMIRGGEHPLTQEGVVFHPKMGIPSKGKLTEEHDVHLTGTFPGEGKRKATIGGFTYGHEPGKTVGKVGTGFSDSFLNEVARDPSAYTGRVARLRAQQKLPSGALRAPSFIALHEDTNKIAMAKLAGFFADPELTIPDVPVPAPRRRRRGPLLPPSWMTSIQNALWGTPDAIVPEMLQTLEEGQGKAAAAHPALADLKKAKSESDRKNYGAKHQILRGLLAQRPDEFVQDSAQGSIVGLTHKPTGFKIHAPARILRGRIKAADLLPWVNLQPQQQRVAKRVGAGENLLVYHGLGSGKSLAGIAAAEGVGGPYTAVVPASLRPNYEGEISKFSTGTTPSEVLSYTGVGMGRQPRMAPNTVIMDEVQRLRNPESAGSRAAMNLAMHAPHRVLLSGTPIVNAPSDLAVPLSILGGKEMTPASFNKQFVGEKTVDPGWMGWFQGVQPTKVPTLQNEDDLEKLLEGHVDYQPSRTPEGVKTNDERVEVDLSPEQQDFYKLMWGKLPWMMRWKLSNDYPLSKDEIAHLSSFMTGPRQAALSLYPFHSSKDPMKAYQTSSKLQSAMKSLKETLGKDPRAKALVYSNFIDAGLTPYAAALKAEGIPYGQFHGTMTEEARKQALADYNEGRSRVLMLGPAAAEGISAKGTQLIQLLDPHWNEARMGQARGRGLRFDSHEGLPPELRDVRIQRFVSKMPAPGWLGRLFGAEARPSADEVLEQQARRKEDLNEQFREVLRRVGSPGYKRPWSFFG